MVAVRCAVRRLGGSLLQRTPAATAEGGRQLAPNRLLRSRGLSSEHACKIAKEQELYERQYQQARVDLREAIRKVEEYRKLTRRPTEFHLCMESFSFADKVKSVMSATAKLTFFCMVAAAAFDRLLPRKTSDFCSLAG